jgi:hypothetical protein
MATFIDSLIGSILFILMLLVIFIITAFICTLIIYYAWNKLLVYLVTSMTKYKNFPIISKKHAFYMFILGIIIHFVL